jgi:Ca2+-binding RTX toxin-like protein
MANSVFNLSNLNGSNGFALNGMAVYDGSGNLVSGAGDINGDGIDDLIIGAEGADPNGQGSGQSYVVFCRREGFAASINLSDLNGSNGFALNGIGAYDNSGDSVSGAGDINGDGIDDLIIGAPFASPNGNYSGQSYVVFGRREPFAAELNLSELNGSNGFALNGIAWFDLSGNSVSGAGDINGDGIDDLIIGASLADPNSVESGQSYVVFGRREPFAAELNLSELDGSNGFALNGIAEWDRLGISVSGAGDIDGDGIDDLIVGASGASPNGNYTGQSYVVFGSRSGFAASINLSDLNGSNGFALNGIAGGDELGISLRGAGDINGDGIDDLIIGAREASPNGVESGQSYVVFGRREGFAAEFNLSVLNGSNGFALNGIAAYDNSGNSVSGAGDINGDGIDDIIIGAWGASPNGNYSGQSYVVFGRREGFAASINLSDLNGSNGFALNGIAGGDQSGNSVSGAGDLNGDGIDDLIIGAPGASPNGNYSGQSYVVYGNAPSVLDLNGNATGIDFATTFTGSAIPVVASSLSLSDRNSPTIARATVTITNLLDGAAESLSANTSGTNIVADYSNGVLTLTGTDEIANYQQVLRTIAYNNSASSPIATNRIIEFIVDDGAAHSNTSQVATTTLSFINIIDGTPGNDTLIGTAGIDRINGFAGDDFLDGKEGNDTINGGIGSDNVFGQNGNDLLNGNNGRDTLNGGNGRDTLLGGNDDDLLTGGLGSDTLNGGSGSDRFIYKTIRDRGNLASGDKINNFSTSSDKLDLTGLMPTLRGYSGDVTGYLQFTQSGSNVLVQIDSDGGGNSFVNLATLTNVSASALLVDTNVLV